MTVISFCFFIARFTIRLYSGSYINVDYVWIVVFFLCYLQTKDFLNKIHVRFTLYILYASAKMNQRQEFDMFMGFFFILW